MTGDGHVLVVDDNEMNRDMLSRRLHRHGYPVMVADGGAQALAILEEHEIALVLLDIEMPHVSGLTVLAQLRQRYSASRLPVIMVTARQDSESIVEALTVGANDYVTKPIDFAVVVARIETQLARRRAESALRESEERYTLAVNGANDGLWDWNLRSNQVYFSPRWQLMLGLGEREVTGTPDDWFNRVHPQELQRVLAAMEAHRQGMTPHFEAEHRMRHADGGFRWMRTRGLVVRDDRGTACRMAGSQTDITDGKVADSLTGLPNRVLFADRLANCIERARRHASLAAVMFLDLDRFKLVNDSLGHSLGDQLLVAVARRLEKCLRASDMVARLGNDHTIARLGGDEFTILLDDLTDLSDALRVAERIHEQLSEPFEIDGQLLFTSASIGIASTAGEHESPDTLLRDADTAMNRAKASGGARSELFDREMREKAVARLQLETDLKRALERGEFRLFYQPIVALASRRIVGFEALIRWGHPERGLISPADFIPAAEESGAIVAIGRWVLGEACRQIARWRTSGDLEPTATVSVNVSGAQFTHKDFIADVRRIISDTDVPPTMLKLELTESAIMHPTDAVMSALTQLRALGVRLAIDDFGTGYSSLSYVHRFPMHSLKIDRSFISSVNEKEDGTEIVRAIVALAHHLHFDVIAEGIEHHAQPALLLSFGCDYGQGYLFSPPLEVPAATRLLAEQRSGDVSPENNGNAN